MKKIVILMLMFAGIFANAGTLEEIQDRGVLNVCMEPENMPFAMKTVKGNVFGYDVDISKDMAEAMGVDLHLHLTDWGSLIPELVNGKCDIIISGMTITQKRNLRVDFTNPYKIMGATLVTKGKYKGIVTDGKQLDKKGIVIAAKIGDTGLYAAQKYFKHAKIVTFDNLSAVMAEVINGGADAWSYDKPHNMMFMYSPNGKKLHHVNKTLSYEMMGWAIKKHDPSFMNWLNAYLRQVDNPSPNSLFKELDKKWFEDVSWMKKL